MQNTEPHVIPADHSANITDNKVKRNTPKKNRDVYFSMSILEAKNLNLTEAELAFYAKASWNIDYEKPYLLNDDGTPMLLKDVSKFMGWGVKGTKAGRYREIPLNVDARRVSRHI